MDVKKMGYAGAILHLDLTNQKATTFPTAPYVEWGGGNGLGTKLFWDFCEDKTITDGRDEKNVLAIATSPLCGTPTPSAGGRCEIVGVGVGHYPIAWFTRSNIGGRYSSMMKFAGFDAIVITGKAKKPVWVDIQNDTVVFHDASNLWGKQARETQLNILSKLDNHNNGWGWQPLPGKKDNVAYSTQKPAVMAIGVAGENQVAHAALVHDAGNTSAQGGFAAVWGAKNLKAISVFGTGSIGMADPAALVEARFRVKERYAPDPSNPDLAQWGMLGRAAAINFAGDISSNSRLQACAGCIMGCRVRYDLGYGNETKCQATAWYVGPASHYYKGDFKKVSQMALKMADYCNDLGINTYAFSSSVEWLEGLYHRGLLGKGKQIDSNLPWEEFGSEAFGYAFLDALAYKKDIGELFADGFVQGAIKAGLEEDYKNGLLNHPYWGVPEHGYDSRSEVEWGYGSILTDRDINSHDFNAIFWAATIATLQGVPYRIEAKEVVEIIAKKLKPYVSSAACMDFSDDNIYSDDVMQLVRWFIHYNRFWKNSALFCDLRWADLFDTNAPGNVGATGDSEVGEQVYWNAVTGEGISFVEGLQKGQRVYLLQNIIWALQGRHRDMVHFAPYIYNKDVVKTEFPFFMWPCRDENGLWQYKDIRHRHIDKEKFEDFKTRFYKAEGMDEKTGWVKLETIKKHNLEFTLDELKKHNKLVG